MATIGVMTTEFDVQSLDEVADLVAAHRLGSVQLQLGSAVRNVPTATALLEGLDALGEAITEDLAQRCRTVFEARGVEIAAVDGTYNMVHPDFRRRRRNLTHLIRLIELAPTFGTRIVTLCTGSRDDIMWRPHPDNQTDAAWRDLLIELEPAAAAAEAAGVLLAFEPEHNNVVNSARRARRLIDDLGSPVLKVLMDAANIFDAGDLDRMPDHLHEAFDLVGADIALAHAKDLDHEATPAVALPGGPPGLPAVPQPAAGLWVRRSRHPPPAEGTRAKQAGRRVQPRPGLGATGIPPLIRTAGDR